jgi:phage-related protein
VIYACSGITRYGRDGKAACLDWEQQEGTVALPAEVVRFFGHALHFAQHRESHSAAKVLKGFGGGGVLEIVENDAGGTYRAVYTVKFETAVFVLHCFQKKSRSGIATPKSDMDIIRARLKIAEVLSKEIGNDKTGG